MEDFDCNTVLESITYLIEFEIRKHGQRSGMKTVEEAVNSLSNYELLVMIADYLETKQQEATN